MMYRFQGHAHFTYAFMMANEYGMNSTLNIRKLVYYVESFMYASVCRTWLT